MQVEKLNHSNLSLCVAVSSSGICFLANDRVGENVFLLKMLLKDSRVNVRVTG